jgi:hypothetical protein
VQHDLSQQCICEAPAARHDCFESTYVGCDQSNGRYADVSLERCTTCVRLWVRYQVEYEGFSGSGRWARGLISADDAEKVTATTAAGYIDRLEWYLRGGSYFGAARRSSGPITWDL